MGCQTMFETLPSEGIVQEGFLYGVSPMKESDNVWEFGLQTYPRRIVIGVSMRFFRQRVSDSIAGSLNFLIFISDNYCLMILLS
jgi:hypothetical protein